MCVWNAWTDVKLRWPLIFFYGRGSPGSRGGRWSTKTPPRDPCKRTCGTLVVHLGAFKSQLVATIVHIYIYISNYLSIYLSLSFLVACWWDSVPDGSLQWSSSCLVCVYHCLPSICWRYQGWYPTKITEWTNYRFTTRPPHRNWSTCWCPRWPWSWRGATARSQEMVVAPGKNVIQWYISGFNRDIIGYN